MCAPSQSSPATRTCVPSAATATTDMASPARSHALSLKSEAGCLLAPELRHPATIFIGCSDEIKSPVRQRRRLGGLGSALGEDAVDRALADLESGGNLDPGSAGRGQFDHLRR